ncbi:MAG: imidazolonepropionase [Lachnoclostridium sp.]|nr:imidazolonepropionase [Lachnoclostridium sp.]
MLIKNISSIVGITTPGQRRLEGYEMSLTGKLDNAWLRTDGELIADFDSMDIRQPEPIEGEQVIDAEGGMLFPSFCDSHTHIVYAGSREGEFVDKIKGLSYEEIADNGGGILNSADLLHATSEDELYRQAMQRVAEITASGTGSVEIKSGYGLNTADELKMLRVIRRIAESTRLVVKSTFLGAHAVSREYLGQQDDYVNLVINEMLPAVAAEKLADYVDVFCDQGFFTVRDTERILEAAARYGLRPKIHANELARSGGVQVGVSHDALSVDHLERMGAQEIETLHGTTTMPVMLPGASFFLGMPYAPARQAIDAGLGIALASDYNPGSSPSGSMKMVMSFGCIKMGLTPVEALNATTLNGAYAIESSDRIGSICPGKFASFFITHPIPSLDFFPYAYTSPLISRVFLKGQEA